MTYPNYHERSLLESWLDYLKIIRQLEKMWSVYRYWWYQGTVNYLECHNGIWVMSFKMHIEIFIDEISWWLGFASE